MEENVLVAVMGAAAGSLPLVVTTIKKWLQMRRLNSVNVDKSGLKVTVTTHGHDPIELDLTDEDDAKRLKDYLDRYDSPSAG
ncbi:hypothetical protein ACIHFC_34460 [Streptomyces sp. NPDC052013]|uniref:hypothetical protein n=1 Tax=unclassified Streptomyces TaxID=2593676 RepID=UPI00344B4E20